MAIKVDKGWHFPFVLGGRVSSSPLHISVYNFIGNEWNIGYACFKCFISTKISFPLNNTRNNEFHRINITKITNWTYEWMNNTHTQWKQWLERERKKWQSQYAGVSVQHFSIIGEHVINKYNMNEWIDFANRRVHRDGRGKAIVAAPAAQHHYQWRDQILAARSLFCQEYKKKEA